MKCLILSFENDIIFNIKIGEKLEKLGINNKIIDLAETI